MNESELLSISNVSKVFRVGGMILGQRLVAVDNVSLSIPGDKPVILSIVGESGCGKTTLTKMILRLLEPSGGSIHLMGKDYRDHRKFPAKMFSTQVQPIFQNPFEAFSMRKKVESYLFNTALKLGIAKTRSEAETVVDTALKSVGLSYDMVRGKYATQFSGGELQRVSIARALITQPRIIIADEPVAMIDASMKMNIVNLFKRIKDTYNVSFIYITHDLSTAYYVSDYIATLYRGSMIEYGPSKQIMESPAHPYTELLMNSVPHVGERWQKRISMPDIESKEYSLTCCKFAPRCPHATKECRETRPSMAKLGGVHEVLCYHPLNQAAAVRQDT